MSSLATGIRAKLGPGATLTISPGCNITNSTAQIIRAVSDAKAADVVILALGEPRDWTGESKSRTHLNLPGRQLELFQAVAATGKPVIVVLFNGRPLSFPEITTNAAAILEARSGLDCSADWGNGRHLCVRSASGDNRNPIRRDSFRSAARCNS